MKKNAGFHLMILATTLFLSQVAIGQNGGRSGKSQYTWEEVKRMCMPVDTAQMKIVLARQDSMRNAFNRRTGLSKAQSSLSWRQWMGPVAYQQGDPCTYDCWAHAGGGLVEGQQHISIQSNIGILIDATDIVNGTGKMNDCQNQIGSVPSVALDYAYHSKVISVPGSYPNLAGVRWGVSGYNVFNGSTNIINSLQYGPVTACFYVHPDFATYFGNPTAVYYWNGQGDAVGHCVVIVGYDNVQQYWLCKNSWGSSWADGGYFRIGFFECGIDSWENCSATVTQSRWAKLVPDLMSLQTAVNNPFVANEWAVVRTSTTVNSGTTLNVPSGAHVAFQNSLSLTVNGTLNASNATFDRSGSSNWGGITFNSGSSGSLSLCTIRHANNAIYLNGVLPSISNCVIWYNNVGIWLNNVNSTSPAILNNNIAHNSIGIDCYFSSPTIDGDHTTANSFAGIFCLGSSPTVRNASQYFDGYGIYAANNSQPTVSSYNRFVSEGTAIHVESPVYVSSGYSDVYAFGQQYAVSASNSAIFGDGNNYWGQFPPDPTDFSASGGAMIFYLPGHGSVWTGPLEKSALDRPVSVAPLANSPGEPQSRAADLTMGGDFAFDQPLQDAAQLWTEGKYEQAIDSYELLLKGDANAAEKKYVLTQLAQCYRATGKADFIDFLNTEVRPGLSGNDQLYATTLELENLFLIAGRDYSKAIDNYDFLSTNFRSDENTLKNSLFTLRYIHSELLSEKEKAKQYFDELKEKFPDDVLTQQGKYMMGEIDSIPAPEPFAQNKLTSVSTSTGAFELSNYPNPFNPTTTIQYGVTKSGHVSLKVYDVLGREVATLIDAARTPGKYSVSWKADRQSSGIYIVRFEAGGQIASKKILLLK